MNQSRRHFFRGAAIAAAVGTSFGRSAQAQLPGESAKADYVVRKDSPINHSVMGWCFNPMPAPELAKHCAQIGLKGIEGIGKEHYPAVRALGLEISLVSGGHGFKDGPCNPANTEKVLAGLNRGIDLAVAVGAKKVITFTGMKYEGMDPEKAADLCVETWKKVMAHAEKQNITLVMEHLNSRDDSHPMKGHPGYFGDDLDFCAELVKRVGSPNFKLLFDCYHVSVMNGDVIRRIRQYQDIIGHYHTAGNPGRGELDETQEINYPAIMREIVKTGYRGYVAHEFIPNWDDKIKALRHGVQVCDIQP